MFKQIKQYLWNEFSLFWKIVGSLVGALVFFALFGTHVEYGREKVGEYYFLARHVTILVGPISLGFVIGYLASNAIMVLGNFSPLSPEERKLQRRSLIFSLLFIIASCSLWYPLKEFILSFLDKYSSAVESLVARVSFVSSIVISWYALRSHIQLNRFLKKVLEVLSLGCFVKFNPPSLTRAQQKIIWITFLIVIYLVLFPPRFGYSMECSETDSSSAGLEVTEFVGLFFVGSSNGSIYVANNLPDIGLEIHWHVVFQSIITLLVVSSVLLIVLGFIRYIRCKNKDDK